MLLNYTVQQARETLAISIRVEAGLASLTADKFRERLDHLETQYLRGKISYKTYQIKAAALNSAIEQTLK